MISLTVSSVQFILGLPTLLLGCTHFLNVLLANDTLYIELSGSFIIRVALFRFNFRYASTKVTMVFDFPSSFIFRLAVPNTC